MQSKASLQRSHLRQPSTSTTEDESTRSSKVRRADTVTRSTTLPQRTTRLPPGPANDLTRPPLEVSGKSQPSASISRLARPGSNVTPLPKAPFASNANDARKAERDAMPPPSLLGRAQSLRRPEITQVNRERSPTLGSSTPLSAQRGAFASPKTTGGHEAPVNPSLPALARSASTRIPGSGISTPVRSSSTRSPHGRMNSVSTATSTQSFKPSTMRSGLPNTMHARSKSSTIGGPVQGVSQSLAKPPSVRGAEQSGEREPSSSRATAPTGAARFRPAFSTLQQHFSPAKSTSKPPLPSSRPSPALDVTSTGSGASFETSKLQAELLYLSILHQEAQPSLRTYELSADKVLRKDFESLRQEIQSCEEAEHSYQGTLNAEALAEWVGSFASVPIGTGQDLAAAVRSLSSCLQELVGLSGPQGRYSTLIEEFTAWTEQAETIYNKEAPSEDDACEFVEALPRQWHDSHTSVSQRLRLLDRDISRLPPLPGNPSDRNSQSALARILAMLKSLTSGMRQELDALADVERLVLSREKQRIYKAVLDVQVDEAVVARSAWHVANQGVEAG